MRALPALVIAAFLLTPAAGALIIPTPSKQAAWDITDADLLAALAQHQGLHVTRIAAPNVPADLTLRTMVERLAIRSGNSLMPDESAPFDALHPLIAAPTLQLLVAMDAAWTLRDQAFANATEAELRAAHDTMRTGQPTPSLLTQDQKELLVNAAIMLTDTLESIVLPQLATAANLPIWPATAIADPVGILRIGGTGNDLETLHRLLQIDPRGDDTYRNNAGGTTILEAGLLQTPIAISLDLNGNDYYRNRGGSPTPAQGGGVFGIGLLHDALGKDHYECSESCQGGGSLGIGLLRDPSGDDYYTGASDGQGMGSSLFGILRDDAGDDYYRAAAQAGGWGVNRGTGLFWDRSGTDQFWTSAFLEVWGYGEDDGDGWFINEGPEIETYRDAFTNLPHPIAGNDKAWLQGSLQRGVGMDNAGGLAKLLAGR